MEGYGVVEVEIPGVEPIPGSKYVVSLFTACILPKRDSIYYFDFLVFYFFRLEAKMRAEGRIISRDFKSPDDKKWLEMDIEDGVHLAGGIKEIPFYESEEWPKFFVQKP